jgi:NAD(P)-dependent dehydrogenase (short-subunit alcohol dehydrogenase family)
VISDFRGRTAVVTGAASGIGHALAAQCGMEGMHVVAADVEDGPLTETVELIGGDAIAVSCDVSASESVDALADAAFDAFGEVHLLCNNAGVFQAGSVWDATVTEWEWALGVNVWGIIHGIRAFVPRMLAQGSEGHVVNTSSLAAFMSGSMTAPYNVSKGRCFRPHRGVGRGPESSRLVDRRVRPRPGLSEDSYRRVTP